jgi:hypothetical protein
MAEGSGYQGWSNCHISLAQGELQADEIVHWHMARTPLEHFYFSAEGGPGLLYEGSPGIREHYRL